MNQLWSTAPLHSIRRHMRCTCTQPAPCTSSISCPGTSRIIRRPPTYRRSWAHRRLCADAARRRPLRSRRRPPCGSTTRRRMRRPCRPPPRRRLLSPPGAHPTPGPRRRSSAPPCSRARGLGSGLARFSAGQTRTRARGGRLRLHGDMGNGSRSTVWLGHRTVAKSMSQGHGFVQSWLVGDFLSEETCKSDVLVVDTILHCDTSKEFKTAATIHQSDSLSFAESQLTILHCDTKKEFKTAAKIHQSHSWVSIRDSQVHF